ncbi:MAG: type IV secretory system conjugative DNA transfer family protein [Candidatus Paceibacterota bacterium]
MPETLPNQPLKSQAEEADFLRENIRMKESAESAVEDIQSGASAQKVVKEYAEAPHEVITEERQLSSQEEEGIMLDLEPEEHDSKMNELLGIMHEKGIKNTLSIVRKMDDPHIEDDFHRLLVQYLKAGYPVEGLKESSDLAHALKMTLFEVVLPQEDEHDRERELKQLVSSMEQFYAGMLTQESGKREHMTIELAVEHVGERVSFYVSVPNERKSLFEKQLLSVFPDAVMTERKNDYNIFNRKGETVGSYIQSGNEAIYPIKLYDAFDHDPLSVILNAFSKLKQEGEGALIQLSIAPDSHNRIEMYRQAIKEIEAGTPLKEAIHTPTSFKGGFMKAAKEFVRTAKEKPEDTTKKEQSDHLDELEKTAVEKIQEKISSPIASTNIRLVASATSKKEAERILHELEASFSQFASSDGNTLSFKKVKPKALDPFLHSVVFRLHENARDIPLNITELTSLVHFPVRDVKGAREVERSKAPTAPISLDAPEEGVRLGTNVHRGVETPVYMTDEDRLRHMYIIGQTGTGKTTLMTNLITQDIKRGEGVCMIDPHGSDIESVLSTIPQERFDDVIYFDPSQTARPMALNMLEYDERFPEQKTFVVNELLGIFNKLFDMKTAGGPMFEQYFRNAVLLTIDDPESGNTLLDVSRVLSDPAYRKLKLSRTSNPVIKQYWEEVAEKAGGEASLQNIVPYITSKFDVFLSNDIMRPIVAQPQSSLNFRNIMDEQKILLVNLSKGRLGDINANLIGLIIVGKILMAALSRVDTPQDERPPFYLYVDEFQNVTTDSISTILSEARKYKLSLTMAHQFIAQLEDSIKDSVFGNVGSMAVYRTSSEDAEFLSKRFEPTFSERDITELDNFNFYAKLLMDGQPAPPFNVRAEKPIEGDESIISKLKELSSLTYGRPREEIEREIMKRYESTKKEI